MEPPSVGNDSKLISKIVQNDFVLILIQILFNFCAKRILSSGAGLLQTYFMLNDMKSAGF